MAADLGPFFHKRMRSCRRRGLYSFWNHLIQGIRQNSRGRPRCQRPPVPPHKAGNDEYSCAPHNGSRTELQECLQCAPRDNAFAEHPAGFRINNRGKRAIRQRSAVDSHGDISQGQFGHGTGGHCSREVGGRRGDRSPERAAERSGRIAGRAPYTEFSIRPQKVS